MPEDKRDRRKMGKGIKLNNTLMTVAILVASWIGTSLETIKSDVGKIETKSSLNAQAVINLNEVLVLEITRLEEIIHVLKNRVDSLESHTYSMFGKSFKRKVASKEDEN